MRPARFRRRRQRTSGHLHPAVIVGICLAAAILLTLLVGNLLNHWLDDEAYQKLTEGEPQAPEEEEPLPINVRKINAYPFEFGSEIGRLFGTPSISLSINSPDGRLSYASPVADYLGIAQDSAYTLSDTIGELCSTVPYVSGVFTPQAFREASPDLQYAAALKEVALMREFVQAGGDELLLYGLPVDAEHLDSVTAYLSALKAALPQTPVGVAVPLSATSSTNGWELIPTLLKSCDFCALDLTAEVLSDPEPSDPKVSPSAQKLLSDSAYYLNYFNMRILVSSSQAPLVSTIEALFYNNFQILSPSVKLEPTEQEG